MKVETVVEILSAGAGALVGALLGEWPPALTALLIVMLIDMITGVMEAFSGKSTKSKSGFVSSSAMRDGIFKKCAELLMIVIGHQLDLVAGVTFVETAIIFSLIVSETISVVENCAALGVVKIPVVEKVLDILKKEVNEVDK